MPSSEEYIALWKELTDKLAWSVGSTLAVSYGRRSDVLGWAAVLADRILKRRRDLQGGGI